MGVGTGLYMYVVVVQKFTFAISSPDEFLSCKRGHKTGVYLTGLMVIPYTAAWLYDVRSTTQHHIKLAYNADFILKTFLCKPLRYGDGAGNTVENSSAFSLVQMR